MPYSLLMYVPSVMRKIRATQIGNQFRFIKDLVHPYGKASVAKSGLPHPAGFRDIGIIDSNYYSRRVHGNVKLK